MFPYAVFLVLTATVLLGLVLWWRRRPSVPREVDWPEVMAEAETGGYRRISTDEMADHYRRDPQSLLLVDTRPEPDSRAGHIKGAVSFPMTPTWWGRWRSRRHLAALLGWDKE